MRRYVLILVFLCCWADRTLADSDVPYANITVHSYVTQNTGYEATKAIDNNTTTFWHTQFSPSADPANITISPYAWIIFKTTQTYTFTGLRYTPRPAGSTSGNVGRYAIFVTSDSACSTGWTQVAIYTEDAAWADDSTTKTRTFSGTTGVCVRLESRLTAVGGTVHMNAAEVVLIESGAGAPTLRRKGAVLLGFGDDLEKLLDKYGLAAAVVLGLGIACWRGVPVLYQQFVTWVSGLVETVHVEHERFAAIIERQASTYERITEGLRKTFAETVEQLTREHRQALKEEHEENAKDRAEQRDEWERVLARQTEEMVKHEQHVETINVTLHALAEIVQQNTDALERVHDHVKALRAAAKQGLAVLLFVVRLISPAAAHAQSIGWSQLSGTEFSGAGGVVACENGFSGICGNEFARGWFAWSGCTWDEWGQRLVCFGGGHNGYYGNELYAFNWGDGDDSADLVRLTDPSTPARGSCTVETDCYLNCYITASDTSKPNSRHSYDGLAYNWRYDTVLLAGGALACPAGNGAGDVWVWTKSTGAWGRKDLTWSAPDGAPGDVYAGQDKGPYHTAYDLRYGVTYIHNRATLYAYNQITNTVRKVANNYAVSYLGKIEYDRKNKYVVGLDKVSGTTMRVSWVDMSGLGSDGSPAETLPTATTSDVDIGVEPAYVGSAWDNYRQSLVMWNGGDTVLWLDLTPGKTTGSICTISTDPLTECTDYRWAKMVFGTNPGAQDSTGTHGRFAFNWRKGGAFLLNQYNQLAWQLRLYTDSQVRNFRKQLLADVNLLPIGIYPDAADEIAYKTSVLGLSEQAGARPTGTTTSTMSDTFYVHGDLEGDVAHTWLMQCWRWDVAAACNRARVALNWHFTGSWHNATGYSQEAGMGHDHADGWGLLAWYLYSGDVSYLGEAQAFANYIITDWWADFGDPNYPQPGVNYIFAAEARQKARHIMLFTYLQELDPGNPLWALYAQRLVDGALIDNPVNEWVKKDEWPGPADNDKINRTAAGFWSGGLGLVNAVVTSQEKDAFGCGGNDAYTCGFRAHSPFMLGLQAEALFRHYFTLDGTETVQNSSNPVMLRKDEIRNRLIGLANFVLVCGRYAPIGNYASSRIGLNPDGTCWQAYNQLPTPRNSTNWETWYTMAEVNVMMPAYYFTGNQVYLDFARDVEDSVQRKPFLGTTNDCSAGLLCSYTDVPYQSQLQPPKFTGFLQYNWMIFANDGAPQALTGGVLPRKRLGGLRTLGGGLLR